MSQYLDNPTRSLDTVADLLLAKVARLTDERDKLQEQMLHAIAENDLLRWGMALAQKADELERAQNQLDDISEELALREQRDLDRDYYASRL